MKMITAKLQYVLPLLLLFMLFGLTDPVGLLMPTQVQMSLLGLVIVVYVVYAVFLFQEKPADERLQYVLYKSNRVGFLVGSSILLVGTAVQMMTHALDPWLVWALGGMVAAKVIGFYLLNK